MNKILKSKDGAVFPIVIILVTVGMILFTALADLAWQNYKTIRASNARSNIYYIADYGTERVLKNLETIVESAKIYANEKLRMGNQSDFDKYLKGILSDDEYKESFETYFKEYIANVPTNSTPATDDITAVLSIPTPINFTPPIPGLPNAQYSVTVTKSATFDNDYTLVVAVTGENNGKYVRTVRVEVAIEPWGYETSSGIDSTVKKVENAIYASPQWTSALASSGDIIVKDGEVSLVGDIYVNGKMPAGQHKIQMDMVTGLPYEGSQYGGLAVGDENGMPGHLIVEGNIFTNNFVHTKYPGSTIQVKPRQGVVNYNTKLGQIYDRADDAVTSVNESLYSEKASNLNSNSNDPLNLGSAILGSEGDRQVNETFINYLKDTYLIQKENGGFVYASTIQIDRNKDGVTDTTDQTISIDGSVVLYDNLQTDSKGVITVKNNFYGFRDSLKDYNDASSIITNYFEGKIDMQGRIYDAGVAQVTSYQDLNTNSKRDAGEEFFQTGEAVSLYKNFYAYRINLDSVAIPQRIGDPIPSPSSLTESYLYDIYNPFSFLAFGSGANGIVNRITHILAYNNKYVAPEPLLSEGGQRLDKGMVTLNSNIYSDIKLATEDMGYSEGVLVGTINQTTGETFMGFIKNELADSVGFINYYKARASLTRDAFYNYIAGKYLTLGEIKVLRYDNGTLYLTNANQSNDFINQYVTLNELVESSKISGWRKVYDYSFAGYEANYIVANDDIIITTDNSNMTIKYGDGTLAKQIPRQGNKFIYNGLILSTGKITIDNQVTNRDIEINGAVVSAGDPQNVGIEFSGPGKKIITYDKDMILNVLQHPTTDAQIVKETLTSMRGIVEMFKKVYAVQKYLEKYNINNIPPDPDIPGDQSFKDAVESYATSKSIPLTGTGSGVITKSIDDGVHGPINVDIPITAIEAVANMYEVYIEAKEDEEYYNDKIVLYESVIGKLLAQGNRSYKINKWGTTQ